MEAKGAYNKYANCPRAMRLWLFSILSRALKKLPLPEGSPDAPTLMALMSAHELRAALEGRGCEVIDVERLDASSPLPAPESFMDTLDPCSSPKSHPFQE